MTDREMEELKRTIREEVKEDLKRINGKKSQWFTLGMTAFQVLLAAILGIMVAWARDVNAQLKDNGVYHARMESWVERTSVDAKVIKMEAVEEASVKVNVTLGRIEGRIDALQSTLAAQGAALAELKASLTRQTRTTQ